MSSELTQIINEDIRQLNVYPKVNGKIGRMIGSGTYGFVCEWNDGTSEKKVVKILDPKYIKCKNGKAASGLTTILSSASVCFSEFQRIAVDEVYTSEKLAGTKNKHLMSILNGSQEVAFEERILRLIVMPELQTIEQLPVNNSPEEQIVEILCQCCEGLHALHQEPEKVSNTKIGLDALIHNDLKPDNIFVETHHTNGQNTEWYVIGDYSACLNVNTLKEMAPGVAYPDEIRQNPYCAPGAIGITSDIWSLGWILWYWMNGKEHPTQSDIASRKTPENTHKPKNWGNNPELWEVFLKMTEYEPSRRYQSVDILQAELKNALKVRTGRLQEEKKSESSLSGGFAGAAGAVAILAALSGLKNLFADDKKDDNGYLHGKINKDISFMDGQFHGTWNHGLPAKGTFTYNGVKCNGNWIVKNDYCIPFSRFGQMTFSGLILMENEENFYHGKASISWNSGTRFDTELKAGAFQNGLMTFQNGLVRSGKWEIVSNNKFSGIFCGDGADIYGCGVMYLPGDVTFEGELYQGRPAEGSLVFPNRIIYSGDIQIYQKAWKIIYDMRNFRSSFSGTWSKEGFPDQGTYTFSNGETVTGRFSYIECEEYTGMILNGKACGIGEHPMEDGMLRKGEFLQGDCHGFATVNHECGAYFTGSWKRGQITEGVVVFSDRQEKYSKNWTTSEIKLQSGHMLQGIFCKEKKSFSGIGKVTFMPQESLFYGEVQDNECKNGIHYDKSGNKI